jgi:hypothetical protein
VRSPPLLSIPPFHVPPLKDHVLISPSSHRPSSGAEALPEVAQGEIDAYMEREASFTVPWRSTNYTSHRPDFVKVAEDPKYLTSTGGALKDFQLTGLNWLAYLWSRYENGILADEVRSLSLSRLSFLRIFR